MLLIAVKKNYELKLGNIYKFDGLPKKPGCIGKRLNELFQVESGVEIFARCNNVNHELKKGVYIGDELHEKSKIKSVMVYKTLIEEKFTLSFRTN